MKYTSENKLRVFTSFSGYDSQCLALERVKRNFPGFDYELVGWSEIDKNAIQAHNLLRPEDADKNYGDISQIDWHSVPDFDFFTYSSPCQDVSNAGLQRGIEEGSGTRSSLLWECKKAIYIKRPKYLMMENVAALVSNKFLPDLRKWLSILEGYGYTNYLAPQFTKNDIRTRKYCLNSKNYGVPQNRERVIIFSILGGSPDEFRYPEPFPLERHLQDVLEQEVDDKYYLSEKSIEGFFKNADDGQE